MTENNNNDPNLDQWVKVNSKKKNNSNKKVVRNNLDIKSLENWLWEAACKIRGPIDAPKYKDYLLPLIFIKRLSDVFEDELEKLIQDFGNKEIVEQLLKEDHSLVRFYITKEARWEEILKKTTNIGEYLTDCTLSIAKENPKLQGVVDIVDFNATTSGQRIISDEKLRILIDILGRYRLGLDDVEADIFGRAYEYLLRKFAEGSGQSAGEFYTPREVALLMSYILEPEPGYEIYDPCCGSGGLLIKSFLRFSQKFKDKSKTIPLSFFGQEINPSTYAMAKMNAFIHDMEASIMLGDTMVRPSFTNEDGSLKKFNIVTANPMWNQSFSQDIYENDPFERFNFGYPPSSSADWGWIQHMFNSLKKNGKVVVILDTGAISRGSNIEGSNREKTIRAKFVEQDLLECIILLPENLFYNTSSAGVILVINKEKKNQNQILLIDASNLFKKGTPKNYLEDKHIEKIHKIYTNFIDEQNISKIISTEDVINHDYNLTPSHYITQDIDGGVLSIEDAFILLKEAEEELSNSNKNLKEIIKKLELVL